MSGRRGGYGRSAFGIGVDYNELKKVQLDIDARRTMILPVNGPVNEQEKQVSAQFIRFQELVKDGPFYTGASLNNLDSNKKEEEEQVGINDGIKRYSDRYTKKRKVLRSLNDYPFKLEFLPTELHDVVNKKSKGLKLNSYKANSDKFYLDTLTNGNGEDDTNAVLERLKNMAEDENDEKDKADQEVEQEIEDEEDEFEDDDDDDYNAEKYFDDGDDFGDEMGDGDDEAAF